MDADEDVSARILLRNVLHTEPPRTPATRGATRAQASAKPSTLRRSGRLRRSGTGAPTPTDALRRSMKQRLHESTSSMFPSPSKRRTVSARVRKTDTPASDSLLNDDATPRHLLKGILQTEAETSMVQSQTVWREPEVPPPADSSLNRNRPSSGMSDLELPTNLSDLDLPNMSTINLGDSGKGLSRKRPRRSLNITEFRRGVERRLQQANEEEKEGGDSADDLSGLSTSSLDSVTLSLKTPAVDVQTEKRGLRRRLPGRREIVGFDKKVEDFCAAVQNRLGEGHPEPGDITEHDITSDIIVGSQDLYARSVAMGDTISVTATREEGKEKEEEEMELSGEAGQGESSVGPIQVEEENMLESQTEEDGAEILTEEEELAKIQTEGDEVAESQTDEEREEIQVEEGAETQTEDEEVPESQSNEEEEIAETQTEEEEGVAETQTEEGAEFQTDKEEMAETQTDKEEGEESEMDQEVAATLREQEEVAESQTGEEEEVAEPQTEEEEVAESQTGEEEVAEPQTEEEEVAEPEVQLPLLLSEEEVAESQTGEEEVAEPQTEEEEEEEEEEEAEPQTEEEEVAEPQTEEKEVAEPQTGGGEEGAEPQQLEEWEEEEEEEEDGSQYEESSMTMPAWVTERRQALPIAPLVTPTVARVSTGVAVVKPKKVKPPKQPGSAKKKPELPKSYVMSVFKHFAKTRVSADVYPVLKEIMNRYFDRLSDDLEAYAAHAKRTTIEVADVELLLRRQGFVTDAMPVNVLIEKYLPMEYRRLLIPCATGGNHVFPKQKK